MNYRVVSRARVSVHAAPPPQLPLQQLLLPQPPQLPPLLPPPQHKQANNSNPEHYKLTHIIQNQNAFSRVRQLGNLK